MVTETPTHWSEFRKNDTFRSPEMLAPARMPVAEGKKMENMPKKLPSFPRQLGTKFVVKISAVKGEISVYWRAHWRYYSSVKSAFQQNVCKCHLERIKMVFLRWIITFVAEETLGLFLWWSRHDGSDNIAGKWHHDDQEEQNLGLNKAEYMVNIWMHMNITFKNKILCLPTTIAVFNLGLLC